MTCHTVDFIEKFHAALILPQLGGGGGEIPPSLGNFP